MPTILPCLAIGIPKIQNKIFAKISFGNPGFTTLCT